MENKEDLDTGKGTRTQQTAGSWRNAKEGHLSSQLNLDLKKTTTVALLGGLIMCENIPEQTTHEASLKFICHLS